MGKIDLQCHTTASDGSLVPAELVELAVKNKLAAIAITDHDTVDGITEAREAAKIWNVELIAGVEISCDDEGFVDTHILGLLIDHQNDSLTALLEKSQGQREKQKESIISKFQGLGFKISHEEVRDIAKGTMGKPHIAKIISKNNPDKVKSADEVFVHYLGVGKPAFVKREDGTSVAEAVHVIHQANGLAFVAHPGGYDHFDIEEFIQFFIRCKGDGIETVYDYTHSRRKLNETESNRLNKIFKKLAEKYSLLETGGSDFHGKEGQVLGKLNAPYSMLDKLKKAWRSKRIRRFQHA